MKAKKTNKNAIENANTKPKSQKLPMECAICGQKSRFKYYNVQSCESCKQFFRRIVLKQKEFHCLKFWICDFSKGERCRGCRLDKCLRLGMDPSIVNVEMTDKLKAFIEKLELRRKQLMDPNYSKFKINSKPVEEIVQNPLCVDESNGSEKEENEGNSANGSPISNVSTENSDQIDWTNYGGPSSRAGPATIITQHHQQSSSLDLAPHQQHQRDNASPWNQSPLLPNLPNFESLLHIEEKIRKIHFSSTELASNYLDNYGAIGDLLLRMDNLLANSEQFSAQPASHWIRQFVIENVQKKGIWGRKPVYYIRDLILVIDFARTIPVYNRLPLEDQITLISSFSLSASRMMISFYSLERNSETMLLPNGMPIAEQFKTPRFANDAILETLPRKVYTLPVLAVHKVAPSKEEFILLLSLLFLNSATSGLSPHGQQLLKEEAEKYGKILLQMQQAELGDQAGALRYMESMSLLWDLNANAQKYRELLVYLDAVYEQGNFERVMPKMLAQLCMQGPRELPHLPGQL